MKITTVFQLIQAMARICNGDTQILVKPIGQSMPDGSYWIDGVSMKKIEGEWFCVLEVAEN